LGKNYKKEGMRRMNRAEGKKILIISRDFPGISGGVSDHSFHLANSLSALGYTLSVLTSDDCRIKEKSCGDIQILARINKWGFSGIAKILGEVKKAAPDWVFIQYVPYMYSRYGIPLWVINLSLRLKLSKVKVLAIMHEAGINFDFSRLKYLPVAFLQRVISFLLGVICDKITVSTSAYKQRFFFNAHKCLVIPSGNNLSAARLPGEEELKALKERVSADGRLLFSVFSPRKLEMGTQLLLESFKAFNLIFPASKLLIIGGFPQRIEGARAEIRKMNMEEACLVTGSLEAEEAVKYFLITDIFLLIDCGLSAMGGVGTKSGVAAAIFAYGKAMIATRGGQTDVSFFKDRVNAYLVRPKADDIIKAMRDLADNPLLRAKLAQNARLAYEKYLRWERIAGLFSGLIEGELYRR